MGSWPYTLNAFVMVSTCMLEIIQLHGAYYLCRPEHENGEEIGPGDEGDDQSQAENTRVLAQTFWEHRVFCTICLPQNEGHEENEAEDEWSENVRRAPRVLISVEVSVW